MRPDPPTAILAPLVVAIKDNETAVIHKEPDLIRQFIVFDAAGALALREEEALQPEIGPHLCGGILPLRTGRDNSLHQRERGDTLSQRAVSLLHQRTCGRFEDLEGGNVPATCSLADQKMQCERSKPGVPTSIKEKETHWHKKVRFTDSNGGTFSQTVRLIGL
eukprot:1158027-Pelagomonas_calceolata.AAC.19